ncbi:MAG: copper resistance protein CopC [Mobilicoccus sp.]|nr:copper resistance protein CopC [Mobilicoccus sp.]
MTLLRRIVLGVCLTLFLVSGLAAHAHSELVESTPADGESLTVMPQSATLVFNEAVDPNFAQAVVADADGVARPVEPAVAGSEIVVPIPGDVRAGDVEVRYRIVSADGHPVGGSITFTVGDAAAATSAEDAAAPTPDARAYTAPAEQPETSTTWMYVLTGLAAALVVLAGIIVALMHRRS